MSNLILRILTATVLGGLVVLGTLHLPLAAMGGLFALILFGAALEWAQLAGFATRGARIVYAIATVAAALACVVGSRQFDHLLIAVLVLSCVWWCLAAAWVVHYQAREAPRIDDRVRLALCGWFALLPALVALLALLSHDPIRLLVLFAWVWGADIFAYFGGKAFGKKRLASRVSPGKTWEGLIAAVLGTQVLAAISAKLLTSLPLTAVMVLAALTVAASVVGDLLESLLKRLCGAKDSGNLLPGHGGLLDRIDSLLAAAPVFTLGLILMEQP